MSKFAFTVKGLPKGQPRPRAFARKMGDKFVARVYDAGTAENWKQAVVMAWKDNGGIKLGGPVDVVMRFYMPRPKSHLNSKGHVKSSSPTYYTAKPDCDNLAKAVIDCLTQIGAWDDDSQIVSLTISKEYDQFGEPGMGIMAEES